MPAKTYECFICGEQVSKPKSWSVARLGLGDEGRACRSHEVVQEAVRVLENNELNQRVSAKVSRTIAIIVLSDKIRLEEYVNGMKYPLLCYENLKNQHNLNDQDIEEIKNCVNGLGPLSTLDIAATLSMLSRARTHSA